MRYGKVKRGAGRWLCIGALTAATPPADPDATIRLLAAQDAAVVEVGERLSVAARSWCPVAGWAAGLVIQTRTQYGADYRDAATRVLRLGDYPTISFVVPGGVAARAGLVPGDQIAAVDAAPLPRQTRSRVDARMAETDQALAALDRGLGDGVADLRILRGDASTIVRLRATPACRVRFEVRAGSDTNASATRDRVQVSSDLVDPARAAQDLAPLIAHELAHVILRHEDTLQRHREGLLPGFGRNGAVLRASEIAADRLSVYLLALAGYRPADAVQFRTSFGRRNDRGILSDRTHPHWRDRVAAVSAEVTRVEAQQAAGAPIRPPDDLLVIPSP